MKQYLIPKNTIPGIGEVNGFTIHRAAGQLYYLKDGIVWRNTASDPVRLCAVGNAVKLLAAYQWLFVSEVTKVSSCGYVDREWNMGDYGERCQQYRLDFCLRVIELDTGQLLGTEQNFDSIVIKAEPSSDGLILHCSNEKQYEFIPAQSSFRIIKK